MQIAANEVVRRTTHRVNQLSEFLNGKTLVDFKADRVLQLAVEHNYWVAGKLISKLASDSGTMAHRAKKLVSDSNFDLDNAWADKLGMEPPPGQTP